MKRIPTAFPIVDNLRLMTAIAALVVVTVGMSTAASATPRPFIYVLGVVQDAGYPQAGCYRPHCMPGWRDPQLRRGATSIAVVNPASGDKLLFDATPDFPAQLYALDHVAPADDTLTAIFLTHAHIGHYAGLMHLGREAMGADGVPVYAMPRMRAFLADNGPWSQLVTLGNIELCTLTDEQSVDFAGGLRVTPFLVPHRDEYSETVGYRIDGPEKSALFIPDIDKWQRWDTDIVELIEDVDYALLDATFFADGELPGRAMSEVPHPFVSESMRLFEGLSDAQKSRVIFIHMNHTNPLLDDSSDAFRAVRERGFRVAREGMRLPL